MNVPVCVVKGVSATPSVEETPCMSETPCVSGVFASVPECVLPGTQGCERGTAGGRDHAHAGNGTRVRSTVGEWNHVHAGHGMRVRTAVWE